jgi:hypothetical protein
VPIVVWGSTMVLKVVDRFPGVVYVGAAVLLWTAVKMIGGEPMLKPWLEAVPPAGVLLYLAIPLVLGVAFVRNHRRLESRIRARMAATRTPRRGAPATPAAPSRRRPRRTDPSSQPLESDPCSTSSSLSTVRSTRFAPSAT